MKTKSLNEIKEILSSEFSVWYCDIPYDWQLYTKEYAIDTLSRLTECIDNQELLCLFQEMLDHPEHELNHITSDASNIDWIFDTTALSKYQKLLQDMIDILKQR